MGTRSRSTVLHGSSLPSQGAHGYGDTIPQSHLLYVDYATDVLGGDATGTLEFPFASVNAALAAIPALSTAHTGESFIAVTVEVVRTLGDGGVYENVTYGFALDKRLHLLLKATGAQLRLNSVTLTADSAEQIFVSIRDAQIDDLISLTATAADSGVALFTENVVIASSLTVTSTHADAAGYRAHLRRGVVLGAVSVHSTFQWGWLVARDVRFSGTVLCRAGGFQGCSFSDDVSFSADAFAYSTSLDGLALGQEFPVHSGAGTLVAEGVQIGFTRCSFRNSPTLLVSSISSVTRIPCDDYTLLHAQLNQVAFTQCTLYAVAPFDDGRYGDGSDGDGVITVPTTLTRTMYYDTLHVDDTVLTSGGAIIFVRKRALISGASGAISADASGNTAGAGGRNGGAGGQASGPVAGAASTFPAAGTVSPVPNSSGAGGTAHHAMPGAALAPQGDALHWRHESLALGFAGVNSVAAGLGGGGGGPGISEDGGDGGGGGGIVILVCRDLEITGGAQLLARGGNGLPGGTGMSNLEHGGGGGGGTGGFIFVLCDSFVGDWDASHSVAGGAGGASGGGVIAQPGAAGGEGLAVLIRRREMT